MGEEMQFDVAEVKFLFMIYTNGDSTAFGVSWPH